MRARAGGAFRAWHAAIAVAVTALGVALRVTNARTIHGYGRVSDFPNTVRAIEWMARERRLFDAAGELHNSNHGPLFYALAAPLLTWSDRHPIAGWERFALPAIVMSVTSWALRQFVLDRGMREALPGRPWTRVLALGLHAVLPVSVYQDGVFYNESLHATLFAASLFFLLRIERAGPVRVRAWDAAWFGVFGGLALITKPSAMVLLASAAALVLGWALRARWRWPLVVRDVTRPSLWALGGWGVTAGWWIASNLLRYDHPLPHQYTIRAAAVIANHPPVGEPLLYHRPLGWYFPVETEFLKMPYASWARPNFWQQTIAGTWVDDINHGFCRMTGPSSHVIWTAPVTDRCFAVSQRLVALGLFLTVVAVAACGALAWRAWRTRLRAGSLVVPLTCALTVVMLAMFGAKYPFDHHPVIKATYALHLGPMLCACVALGLLEPDARRAAAPERAGDPHWRANTARAVRIALRGAIVLAVAGVGVLVAQELWAG